MTVTLTPEVLADLRRKADASLADHAIFPSDKWTAYVTAANPAVILAMLDRIESLESVVRVFMEDPHAYTPRAVEAARDLGFGGDR